MNQIILDLTISLDGFIEGTNREVDWIVFDDEIGQDLCEFAEEIDTVLYGRISYGLYGNYLPNENAGQFEKDFYKKVNKMNKYVFSKTIKNLPGTTTLINDNIREHIGKIKEKAKKNIWLFGGAGLITTLLNLDLIDEIRIGINPIILGEGNSLFKNIISRKALKLIQTKTYKSGVVGLYYEPLK